MKRFKTDYTSKGEMADFAPDYLKGVADLVEGLALLSNSDSIDVSQGCYLLRDIILDISNGIEKGLENV